MGERQFDPWQREAIEISSGRHLVLAPPGCGKPDMSIDDEGDLAWIKKTDLPVLPGIGNQSITLWEGDKIFLRLLLDENTPFFSLKLVYEQDEMVSATLNGKRIGIFTLSCRLS